MCLKNEIWNQRNAEDLPGSFLAPEIESYFFFLLRYKLSSALCQRKKKDRTREGRKHLLRLLKLLIESVIQEISFSLLLVLKWRDNEQISVSWADALCMQTFLCLMIALTLWWALWDLLPGVSVKNSLNAFPVKIIRHSLKYEKLHKIRLVMIFYFIYHRVVLAVRF